MRVAAVVLLLVGCAAPVVDPLGLENERLAPPSVYAAWWDAAGGCLGIHRPMRITFYVVAEIPLRPQAVGLWVSPHTVYLRRGYELSESLLRHEMTHDLLQAGDEAHHHPCFGGT